MWHYVIIRQQVDALRVTPQLRVIYLVIYYATLLYNILVLGRVRMGNRHFFYQNKVSLQGGWFSKIFKLVPFLLFLLH